MSNVFRPSAEELGERRKASRLLHRMEIAEGLAQQWEREAVSLVRRSFAERYRTLIGVHPSQRSELQQALERVQAGGGMPVQDVLDVLSQYYSANGDGASGAFAAATGEAP